VTILRIPGQLYQEQPNSQMSNLYSYKVLNKTFKEKELVLKPENFRGSIRLIGETGLKVPRDGTIVGTMFVFVDNKDVKGRKTVLQIGVYEEGKKINTITTSFLGPFNGSE